MTGVGFPDAASGTDLAAASVRDCSEAGDGGAELVVDALFDVLV
jgi:hypothetical protein